MAAREPQKIGRYEIRRELGRGMMGVVYEAWDPALGRRIALKTIKPMAEAAAEAGAWEARFQTEARAAARLRHPAIVVVHDIGRDSESGVLYMALEYLEGEPLSERISGGRPLAWREALRIVGRVAEALDHAHSQGVVHRDVKPANIMMLPSGEPKILDFGVARLDEGALTHAGDLCGTPLFMSPEQALGQPLDARSDVFSLGAVTWALLTGRSPFAAQSLSAILARVIHQAPPSPSLSVPDLPPAVDEIVDHAMAKSPQHRYASARALAEDVEDALAGRPLRHHATWTPSQTGALTLASREDLPELLLPDAAPTEAEASRPRGRTSFRAGLLLALLAAAAVYLARNPEERLILGALGANVRARLERTVAGKPFASSGAAGAVEPSPIAASTPPTTAVPGADFMTSPDASPSGAVPEDAAAAAEATSAEIPSEPSAAMDGVGADTTPVGPAAADTEAPLPTVPASGQPPLAREPKPLPSPSDEKQATSGEKHSTGRKRTTAAPAYLSVGLDHGLKNGTLEVWVDATRVAQERLDSRVSRKLLLFERREGSVEQTLRLTPGKHEVRVRVRSGRVTKNVRTSARFRSGATLRLELSLPRLSGDLSMEWR